MYFLLKFSPEKEKQMFRIKSFKNFESKALKVEKLTRAENFRMVDIRIKG